MNLVQGINDNGQIVGFALTNGNTNATVGFDATVPEPSTLLLCGLGIVSALAVRFRRR